MEAITFKVEGAHDGFTYDLATLGDVPAPVADVVHSGRAVPIWTLPGMERLAPVAESGPEIPELLRQRLNNEGWEQTSENLFKSMVATGADRNQVVLFGPWNASSFACMSPVAHAEGGLLPEPLRGVSLEPYSLDIDGDLVVICQPLPAGPPSPTIEEINQTATDLGVFADRIEGDLSTEDEF